MFLALRSALFFAANLFSWILFSMMASSSLVKGRNVGRLLSESFSAWVSDMLGWPMPSQGPGSTVVDDETEVTVMTQVAVKPPQLLCRRRLQLLQTT